MAPYLQTNLRLPDPGLNKWKTLLEQIVVVVHHIMDEKMHTTMNKNDDGIHKSILHMFWKLHSSLAGGIHSVSEQQKMLTDFALL